MRNILSGAAAAFLVAILYKSVDSYSWIYDSVIKENLKTIREYGGLTLDQKYEAKLGFDYSFLYTVRENTPENAVILWPPEDAIKTAKVNQQGNDGKVQSVKAFTFMHSLPWSTYFLYPRRIVSEDEAGKIPLYDSATHVAVVNYWGYDKIRFINLDQNKKQFTILPLDAPAEENKSPEQ